MNNRQNHNSTQTPQPESGGSHPANERNNNPGVETFDSNDLGRGTFDVVNSMPPPPNPGRDKGDNNQG